jgi:hypothetical protein
MKINYLTIFKYTGQNYFNKNITSNSNSSSSLFFLRKESRFRTGISLNEISKIDPESILEIEVVVSFLGSLTTYTPSNKQEPNCCSKCYYLFHTTEEINECQRKCRAQGLC